MRDERVSVGGLFSAHCACVWCGGVVGCAFQTAWPSPEKRAGGLHQAWSVKCGFAAIWNDSALAGGLQACTGLFTPLAGVRVLIELTSDMGAILAIVT